MTENIDYANKEYSAERVCFAVKSLRDKDYFKKVAGSFGFKGSYVEDLIGETVVEVLEHLRSNSFVERANGLEGYFTIAFKRNCLDEKRKMSSIKRKGNGQNISLEDHDAVCPKTLEGIDYVISKESSEILFYEINRLPNFQREQVLKALNKTVPNRCRVKKTEKAKGNKILRERLVKRGVLELEVV